MERLAGRDYVVDDEYALAAELLFVLFVYVEGLDLGGDRLYFDLMTFSCRAWGLFWRGRSVLAGLRLRADALRLGGDRMSNRGLVEQGLRGDLGELDVAEDDERADIEVVGQRAERRARLRPATSIV
ncbi:MAG: hypothetical protein ACLR5G_07460 [Eubacteriales bacterium]